jgi:peptidoglycan/LPS O-acetylase OafA/YrhL
MLPAASPLIRQCAEISLFAPLFALLVWSVVVAPRWLVEAADLPWFRVAGALAFPVYLLQMPVYKIYYQAAVKPFGGEMTWILFTGYLFLLVAGALVWLRYLAPMCGNVFRLAAMRRLGEQLPLGR